MEPQNNTNNKKEIITTALISAGVTVSILVIVFALIVLNQAKIFDFFSQKFDPLFNQEASIIEAVRKSQPAVISIVVTKNVPKDGGFNLFDFFKGGSSSGESDDTEEREIGGGTGFIISERGLAVTNKHVVEDKDATYTAFTNEGEKYEVEVVAIDPVIDIAIVQLKDAKNMTPLSLGDSDKLEVGQTAIAIGNALGEFKNTVSVGVISGLSRSIVARGSFGQAEFLDEVIQTDAAINPGNSGGPLLNIQGEVVGVNVAMASGSENIGFAIPAAIVKNIIASVEQYGRIIRPFLGVRYVTITPALERENKLSIDYGVLVLSNSPDEPAIVPDSPAQKAGIKENDIILEVDGEILKNKSLASLVRRKNVGDTITLKILRGEKEITLKATLVEMK